MRPLGRNLLNFGRRRFKRNFMRSKAQLFSVGFLLCATGGCGDADRALSPAIMIEAEHSHYHVHAADASHEHTHANPNKLGGHDHSHLHADTPGAI